MDNDRQLQVIDPTVPLCMRTGCARPAACALGIALYPPAALMRYYKSSEPLTTLFVSVEECEQHYLEWERLGPFALIPKEKLDPLVRAVIKATKTSCSMSNAKVVRVLLSDPDYQKLKSMRKIRVVEVVANGA